MARDFNGSTQYGQASLDLSAYSTLSVAMWLYVDALPGGGDYDIYYEHTADGFATNGGFAVYSGGTEGFIVNHRGNFGGSHAVYTALSTGTWLHILAVFDFTLATDEVNYYLNGSLQTPGSRAAGNSNNTGAFANSTFNVAARNAASLFADCKMAELAIYASDIGAAGAAMLADGFSPSFVSPGSLRHYWPLIGRTSPEVNRRGTALTLSGTPTQAAHPRIIYPSKPQLVFHPAAAPGGGSILRHMMQYAA